MRAPLASAASERRAPGIAVIGAGVAGAACAAGLLRAGCHVTVYDKSRGVGGRMATRRAHWTDANGQLCAAEFDHGAPHFTVTRPRFRAAVERAERRGRILRWPQRVHAPFPMPKLQQVVVATPDMPAFCRHLLGNAILRPGSTVTGLQRCAEGWLLHLAGDGTQACIEGPFGQVVLAIPAAQAAMLLAGHEEEWAASLSAVRMLPCWTLMAVTDDLDWPWDAAVPERGDLAWIGRNDRKPGRTVARDPARAPLVPWVAHATPAWSQAHLEDDPVKLAATLRAALARALSGGPTLRWHYSTVHRWRYAQPAHPATGGPDCRWRADLGLGVCGDAFGDGSVEAAWCSGDELADAMAAALEAEPRAATIPPRELAVATS